MGIPQIRVKFMVRVEERLRAEQGVVHPAPGLRRIERAQGKIVRRRVAVEIVDAVLVRDADRLVRGGDGTFYEGLCILELRAREEILEAGKTLGRRHAVDRLGEEFGHIDVHLRQDVHAAEHELALAAERQGEMDRKRVVRLNLLLRDFLVGGRLRSGESMVAGQAEDHAADRRRHGGKGRKGGLKADDRSGKSSCS